MIGFKCELFEVTEKFDNQLFSTNQMQKTNAFNSFVFYSGLAILINGVCKVGCCTIKSAQKRYDTKTDLHEMKRCKQLCF